jgi:HEAT repeat protein
MDSEKPNGQYSPLEEEIQVDFTQVDKVKEILTLLAHTVSVMKIFPSEHATVKNFTEELATKMKKFLEENNKLEIGVLEYSFSHLGKIVYTDEYSIKSLPFFFCKDGTQILFFYKGLSKEELQEFLELIKKQALLPPDESDIVNALWERDFPDIQYYAPDDFIETKILGEKESAFSKDAQKKSKSIMPTGISLPHMDFHVDKANLTTGRIDLFPEDQQAIYRSTLALSLQDEEAGEKATPKEEEAIKEKQEWAAQAATLGAEEMHNIESLVRTNREIPPQLEYLNLLIEILYLEDKLEQFKTTVEVLNQFYLNNVENGYFNQVITLIQRTQDLRDSFSSSSPEKAKILDFFLNNTANENTLAAIKKFFQKGEHADLDSFFQYLTVLGPQAFSYIAELYEQIKDPYFRFKATNHLEEISKNNAALLMDIANDALPELTLEIIKIFSRSKDKRVIPLFANFLSYRNKPIKLEAVETLSKMDDETANKILSGFLSDRDEELRIQTALRLKFAGDKSRLVQIIHQASKRSFKKKSPMERRALLEFLGRTHAEEARAFLQELLHKFSLSSKSKVTENRILAISALETMGTPEALQTLKKGAKTINKKIREACFMAIQRLSSREQI